MDLKEAKAVLLKEWMDPDGLTRLNDTEHGGSDGTRVTNANGLLFSVYAYYLLDHHGLLDSEDTERFLKSVNLLRRVVNGIPILGLFNRQPNWDSEPEALDNYCAIVSGAALFNYVAIPREIVQYGTQMGYMYDNVNPNNAENVRRWRQGIDVAHYKLCSLYIPAPWETLWFAGGILWNAFFCEETYTSEWLLNWLRLKSADKIRVGRVWRYTPIFDAIYLLTRTLWKWRLNKVTNGKGIDRILEIYFTNPKHPIHALRQGVKY